MEKISKVWFDSRRIYIETDAAKVYSRPLETFPVLLEATEEDRLDRKQLENEQKFEKVFAKWQTQSPRWGRCSRARLSPRARRRPCT